MRRASTNRPRPLYGLAILLGTLPLLGAELLQEAASDARETPPREAPKSSLAAHVRHLTSEPMGGRLAGTPGEARAADYLVARLEELGAQPLPGQSLRIPFEFAAGTRDAGSSLVVSRGDEPERWGDPEQVRALSFSSDGKVSGPAVFAGYGLVVPDALGTPYDSYAGLDVEGKVVVVLRYFPEDLESERRVALSRYAGLRYKALAARERGAVALVVVTGPRSPNAGRTIPMTFDTAVSGSGIAAVSVGGEVGEALFRGLEQGSLEEVQRSFDDGNPHVTGFPLPDVELTLDVRLERERRRGTNVVGVIPGRAPDGRAVLVGAHFDHLGNGEHGNSLARDGEKGAVHPGADDNASGVAAVLGIGKALAAERPQRDVVLAFWSGEELGLLGSADFVKRELVPSEKLLAVVNLDMVGRARDNRLALQGIGSSPAWRGLVERANVPVRFDLQLQQDPHLPTDSSVFNAEGVATLNIFTGAHEDYHRPTDTPDRLDYEELARVVKLASRVTRDLAGRDEPLEFVEVERSHDFGPGRASLRAYTGTVPDYTSEVEGLRLSDVVKGGPAEKAGLRGGDVILRFGTQSIANIYDYTYALDAAEVGKAVRVVFRRDGEELEVVLTPEARR